MFTPVIFSISMNAKICACTIHNYSNPCSTSYIAFVQIYKLNNTRILKAQCTLQYICLSPLCVFPRILAVIILYWQLVPLEAITAFTREEQKYSVILLLQCCSQFSTYLDQIFVPPLCRTVYIQYFIKTYNCVDFFLLQILSCVSVLFSIPLYVLS